MASQPGFLIQKPQRGQRTEISGQVIVNCLEITRLPQNSFYHYDEPRDVNNSCLSRREQDRRSSTMATDPAHELQFQSGSTATFNVTMEGGKKLYPITLTLVGTINPTSIRPAPGRLVLNVDTTLGLVYRNGDVLELLSEFIGVRDIRELEHRISGTGGDRPSRVKTAVKQFLKGLRVTFVHRRNVHPKAISGIIWESAKTHTFFEDKSGREISVAEYFEGKNHRLRYPNLPIMAKFGQHSAVPLELMRVAKGQIYRGVIPERVQQEMLKISTKKPFQKLGDLERSLESLHHQTSPYLYNSGMQIGTQFMKVNARVLRPPTLRLGQNRQVELSLRDKTKVGAWNMTDKQVWSAPNFSTLVVVRTTKRFENLNIIMRMVEIWKTMGITFRDVMPVECLNPPIDKALDQQIRPRWEPLSEEGRRTMVVLVIVEESDKEKRDCVKWWGDVCRGIITQVVKFTKLQDKGFDQYARNLGLKINAKSGGINYVPSQLDSTVFGPQDRTMVIGLDTSHPGPGSVTPTTAAMVYSIDRRGVDYRCKIEFQPARKELVERLNHMVSSALRDYYDINGNKIPTKIIFYRDGVSEGQFEQVARDEIATTLSALAWVADRVKEPIPSLTFIIVGKKHHVRFFPDRNLADGKDNALPGTQFSHDLCHIYQIATRSVSIPAPVYYADKLASRFPIFFYEVETDNSTVSSGDRSWEAWEKDVAKVNESLKERKQDTFARMFWL
ncbi:hypothetical protein FRC14_005843 [Serendipita sp. 396]|nr:hypothetical protein FRC14_005843 [Serendipita sp. 396]